MLPLPMQLARLHIGLFVFLGQTSGSIGARREKNIYACPTEDYGLPGVLFRVQALQGLFRV